MSAINWLRYKQPGFAQLSDNERNTIGDFVFLWSLFEAKVLNNNANARNITTSSRNWSDHGLLSQQTLNAEQAYVRNRYCPDGHFSEHFRHLNFRRRDKEALVRRFLRQECRHAWEDVAALLIVVYRLRNNLFHGLKWAYNIQDQRENFENANSALLQAIELNSCLCE